MGQTKRKRKRKHRGTPAGTIETRGRTGRPPTKAEAKQRKTAQDRRAERMAKPPTWRGAFNRSIIAAALFGLVVILLFGQPVGSGIALAAVMVLLYMPMTYYMDLFIHRRFRRKLEGGGGRR